MKYLKRATPLLAVLFLMFGLAETASAAFTLTDIVPADLKAALTGIPALFTEWGGLILSALGILLVIGLVRKFL